MTRASESPAAAVRHRLTGVLPPITMPFDRRGELVKGGLREQIDFIVGAVTTGLAAAFTFIFAPNVIAGARVVIR